MQEAFRFFPLLLFFFNLVVSQDNFIYNGFLQSDISLYGASYIRPEGILGMTNNSAKLIGHAFHPSPLQFKVKSYNDSFAVSFGTTFVFSIFPKYPELGGQGLAFVISSSKELYGALPDQNLGLPNKTSNANSSTRLLAVEFDIVQNVELHDINDNHVGIDIDDVISNISAPAAYLTSSKPQDKISIDLKSGIPIQAWIEYDGNEKLVNVTLSPLGMPRSNWPLISFPIDLSVLFDEYMYVGFSAATGIVSASHSLLGWSFKIGWKAPDLDPSKLPPLRKAKKVVIDEGFGVGIGLACIALVLLVIWGAFHLMKRRRRQSSGGLEDWEVEYGARRFDYSELLAATGGFEERNLIGTGGFGSVYKGVIPSSGIEVAIKRVSHDSRQGMKEFVSEIISMGRLRHRNLVQLHGWCRRKDVLLLVYDYVPNGSLDKLLFNNPKKVLTWEQRFGILIGVSQGLLYLHEECEQRVVHRDVKASNVLIDADLNAKLGDFGLARIYEHGNNPQTTHIVGTLGYLAPELTRTGKATTSTDVYGYGALMLEVACGRRPIDPQRGAQELVLVDWVRDLHTKGEIMKAVDPAMDLYDAEKVQLVLSLGLLCSHPLPNYRPSMRRVVQFLLGDATLPHLPPDVDDLLMMAEFSDAFADSDPSTGKFTSSKSTSSFSSTDKTIVPNLGSRSTY